MNDIHKDDRFSKIGNDPRFRRMPKKERKVQIDKRFKNMFTDKKFKLKYSVDKRGRPVQSTTNENFRKYYDISESEENESDDEENPSGTDHGKEEKSTKQKDKRPDEEENNESDEEIDNESDESGLGSGPDLARGEGNVETSSEEDESEDEEYDDDAVNIGDLDRDAEETKEITSRLAVCNMDWDRVKAQDIFVLLQSFKQTGGLIRTVKIYPSEFGIERMKIEELRGPTELTERPLPESIGKDIEDAEGDNFHTEKLRQYQLNRLKYFYAVVDCDSAETANTIYEECDGMEYESSSNKLDLRFIPEDMTFDHEPKTVCSELPSTYSPSLFFTTALCQSKVDLTWDETDQDRLKVTMNPNIGRRKKKGQDNVKEEDFKAYLASSSDEEEAEHIKLPDFGEDDSGSEDEDQQINKYKNLVQSIKESEEEKKNRDVGMEITWEPGLKESAEKIIKKKGKEKDMTVWEKYLEKKKDKRQKKKDGRKKLEADDSDAGDEEELESQSDVDAFSDDELPDDIKADPFFQHPDDKPTKNKKGKKKKKKAEKGENKEQKAKDEAELSLLMMDEENEEEEKKHFSLKNLVKEETAKKRKNKKRRKDADKTTGDDFSVDTTDPRFEALFTSHMYNVDPSAPEYKKTKGMKDIVEAKQKYRKRDLKRKAPTENNDNLATKAAKSLNSSVKDTSLQKLVESVKTKTKQYKNKK